MSKKKEGKKEEKQSAEKIHGKATIVLLLGTSSAGKGTIVKELLRQDSLESKEKRLGWVEDGNDLENRRHPDLRKIHVDMIKEDVESGRLIKNFDELSILMPIFKGILKIGEKEISLLKEFDIDAFHEKLSPAEKEKYTKENIADFCALAQRYHEKFKEAEKLCPSIDEQMNNIFIRAMENSKKGVPTVIDSLAVVANQDVVTRFNKFMADNNFSCPTIIALAHCNISKLVDHMDKRNASGVKEEKREGFFPLSQYGQTYQVTTDDDPKAVGELRVGDILGAAQKYGPDKGDSIVLLQNSKSAQDLVKALGIKEGHSQDAVVKVIPKISSDMVYQTDPERGPEHKENKDAPAPEAITGIAQQLNKLATRDSVMEHSLPENLKAEIQARPSGKPKAISAAGIAVKIDERVK